MVNYGNAKIYCIRSYNTDEIYIGSTCSKLCKRMSGHRKHYKRYKKGSFHYVTSFKILEYDDAFIELIKKVSCNSKEELDKLEGEEIRSRVCVNRRIEGRTNKEYYEDNKEYIKSKNKQYRKDNKESIKNYMKKYREDNKVKIECSICSSLTSRSNIKRHQKSAKCKSFL